MRQSVLRVPVAQDRFCTPSIFRTVCGSRFDLISYNLPCSLSFCCKEDSPAHPGEIVTIRSLMEAFRTSQVTKERETFLTNVWQFLLFIEMLYPGSNWTLIIRFTSARSQGPPNQTKLWAQSHLNTWTCTRKQLKQANLQGSPLPQNLTYYSSNFKALRSATNVCN